MKLTIPNQQQIKRNCQQLLALIRSARENLRRADEAAARQRADLERLERTLDDARIKAERDRILKEIEFEEELLRTLEFDLDRRRRKLAELENDYYISGCDSLF